MQEIPAPQAYILDSQGQLQPFAHPCLLLAFPDGRWLELSWQSHPQDPLPIALEVRSGRMEGVDESTLMATSSGLAVIPLAANLIRLHPYRPKASPPVEMRPAPQ